MSYEVVIYFAGPRTRWARKVAAEDIIAHKRFPWRWLAVYWAQSVCRPLDDEKCGCVILHEGKPIIEGLFK